MQKSKKYNIGIIGSGNVATKLAVALHNQANNIAQVFSPNKENSLKLAKLINAKSLNSINDFSNNLEIIIIAISDKALTEIDLNFLPKNALVCHTSGSVSIEILNNRNNFGVFYPLQTFSIQSDVDISKVPFCLEANSKENLLKLKNLTMSVSENIYEINSEERRKLHLAAVFACNFTNAMYSVAEDLLQSDGLDFNLLRPLIMETARKTNINSPKEIQTGPAIRHDNEIMNKHIEELHKNSQYADLYKTMSDLIQNLDNDKIL
jgi:predicted short-subunit dehydrogenase-like oxidoreductase (DUF2520 family)